MHINIQPRSKLRLENNRGGGITQTLSATQGDGGNNGPLVMQPITPIICEKEKMKQTWCIRDDITPKFIFEKAGTMDTHDNHLAIAEKFESGGVEMNNKWIVRRLTPLECERLQGYPDGWTDIPGATDSKRYKALGNSIALPQWKALFERMKPYLSDTPTLGSMFDGIGGFPLTFEETFGTGSAKWASEIEPFPIEVTKIRFPEKANEKE